MLITPLQPHLAARVDDVGLAAPLGGATFRQIEAAFQEHSVLVFGDQRISDAAGRGTARAIRG